MSSKYLGILAVVSIPTSPDSNGIAAEGLAPQVEKTCGSWQQQ